MTVTEPRPWIIDLFGGRTGGAARGYQLSGWRVVSIDTADCPDNRADVVLRGDALDLLPVAIRRFRPAALHASPPCQGNGAIAQGTMPQLRQRHPDLIPPTREAFLLTGLPWVIENPQHTRSIGGDIVLCGEMFGLGVLMHRAFELGGWKAAQPEHLPHRGYVHGWRHGVWRDGPYVAAYGKGGGKASVDEMRDAKRIDWSRDHLGLRDALPPAYTEYLGCSLAGAASLQRWKARLP